MADTRKKNLQWRINTNEDGTTPHSDAELAVLMDIRDELQAIKRVLICPSFTSLPRKVDEIRRATARIPARKNHRKRC